MPPSSLPVQELGPYLAPERVIFFEGDIDKQQALEQLAACCARDAGLAKPAQFTQAILDREAIGSTGIGNGIAVPHCKLPDINGFVIGIGICPGGIAYAAADGKPVQLLMMIGASEAARRDYLRLLATVAALLKGPERLQELLACSSADQIVQLLSDAKPSLS